MAAVPPDDPDDGGGDGYGEDMSIEERVNAIFDVYGRVADLRPDIEAAQSPAAKRALLEALASLSAELNQLTPRVTTEVSRDHLALQQAREAIAEEVEKLQPTRTLDQVMDRVESRLRTADRTGLSSAQGPVQGGYRRLLHQQLETLDRDVAPWVIEGFPQHERMRGLEGTIRGRLDQLDQLDQPRSGGDRTPTSTP
jgi:hypothetical protein